MNFLLDLEILGWLLVGLGIVEVIPALAALGFGEPSLPYVASSAAALAYGLPIALTVRGRDRRMRSRDGFLVVSAAWALASVFGALPYYLSDLLGPVDSLFESVAGFTTTGSSVMVDIESAPRALLLWRSLTQWLGGMGIIVFTIAVLPLLGIGGMQLFKAEVPGPVTDKLTPRVAETARQLWYIYLGLTLVAILCLLGAGMDWFDATCHALTTLSTGGFSTRNGSIASFHSPAAEWIIIFFMIAAGINFALHYRLLHGQFRRVAGDRELHLYLALVACMSLLVTAVLWSPGSPAESTLRMSTFQVVSLLTTTGFATADYEVWPALAQFTMAHLLLLGGMAGSTSGGIKTLRILLGFRALRTFILRAAHPNAVRPVRYAGRAVAEDVLSGVLVFFIGYAAIAIAAAAVIASAGYDVTTSFTAALTAIGNVGPGLGAIGPTDNFSHMPAYAKLALSFCMIAGRLEIFTVLVLFEPHFWKR